MEEELEKQRQYGVFQAGGGWWVLGRAGNRMGSRTGYGCCCYATEAESFAESVNNVEMAVFSLRLI